MVFFIFYVVKGFLSVLKFFILQKRLNSVKGNEFLQHTYVGYKTEKFTLSVLPLTVLVQ